MANISFDFNKIKRSFFNVTLKSGQTLQVKMPTKRTFGKIQALNNMQTDENTDMDDIVETLAGLMAECLNNNLNGVHIKAADIAEEYDIEEMTAFILGYYQDFVGKNLGANPN